MMGHFLFIYLKIYKKTSIYHFGQKLQISYQKHNPSDLCNENLVHFTLFFGTEQPVDYYGVDLVLSLDCPGG